MSTFDFNELNSALNDPNRTISGVDFSGKSLKLDTDKDAQPIIDAINKCPDLQYLTLTGNTLGVAAAEAIAKALERHPELKICRWSDMFTGRMKTEIPPALKALGDGMIAAGARLTVLDLSDNAFGPIGVEGLARLLQSDVCSQLQELRLNNNGLGITGGRLLAKALSAQPRQLKVFIAGRNRLENDGATALAQVFERMGTLEEISMPQNGIYHLGISALSEAFKHNPRLGCLNLNDNTIGARGAAAFVEALPKLKELKSINFGDCLLKSKGALALAKGLKDNNVLIESLDLSHNEIGREACMTLVDSVTHEPGSKDRLTRVALAGNSLGGSAQKQSMREKLGACAELSDGEESDEDDDDEAPSDEEEEEEEEEEQDPEPEGDEERLDLTLVDASMVNAALLDDSGVEEIESAVGKFLAEPTIEGLEALGPDAADLIDTHLRSVQDPSRLVPLYVSAVFAVGGLGPAGARAALQLYPAMLRRVADHRACSWLLANTMLAALGLIKSETKSPAPKWPLTPNYRVLSQAISQPYFPAALRDTLRFFAASKQRAIPDAALLNP